MKNSVVIFSIFFVLVGCVSTPPDNPDNICKIFQEKRGWYKAAIRTEKRWKLPPYVLMSFVFQESSFKSNAKPDREELFGFCLLYTSPSPRDCT